MNISLCWRPSPEQGEKLCGLCWKAGFHVGTVPWYMHLHLPTGILTGQEPSGGLSTMCLWPEEKVEWFLQQQMAEPPGRMVQWSKGQGRGQVFHLKFFPIYSILSLHSFSSKKYIMLLDLYNVELKGFYIKRLKKNSFKFMKSFVLKKNFM